MTNLTQIACSTGQMGELLVTAVGGLILGGFIIAGVGALVSKLVISAMDRNSSPRQD